MAIIDRLKLALTKDCLPRKLTPDAEGQVTCLILEGTPAQPGKSCSCDSALARSPVAKEHEPAVTAALDDPAGANLGCFCEIDQLSNASPTPGALTACQTEPNPEQAGWCYVDAEQGPEQAEIVSTCPSSQQRQIRFVGAGAPQSGATVFITCAGQ